MFTGIVEEIGKITEVRKTGSVTRLAISSQRLAADAVVNDSISVAGVCLTVTVKYPMRVAFDVLNETLSRSTLRHARPGENVNLEGAVRAGGRIGGHFVLGHVDATGTITSIQDRGADRTITVQAEPEVMRMVVSKGSIALDGVSLTIADITETAFSVCIIPQTLKMTTFRERREGDRINIEVDVLGKYVDRLLSLHMRDTGLTPEMLHAAGFNVGDLAS